MLNPKSTVKLNTHLLWAWSSWVVGTSPLVVTHRQVYEGIFCLLQTRMERMAWMARNAAGRVRIGRWRVLVIVGGSMAQAFAAAGADPMRDVCGGGGGSRERCLPRCYRRVGGGERG